MYSKSTKPSVFPTMFLLLLWTSAFAQTKIEGKITEGPNNEPLIGVSIQIKGKVIGTISDANGKFSFTTTSEPPFSLVVSSVGFQTQEIAVTGGQSNFDIKMEEQAVLGRELVVSASRVEESVLRSPVSIEKN